MCDCLIADTASTRSASFDGGQLRIAVSLDSVALSISSLAPQIGEESHEAISEPTADTLAQTFEHNLLFVEDFEFTGSTDGNHLPVDDETKQFRFRHDCIHGRGRLLRRHCKASCLF
jgi:hypothetical protein